MNRYYSDEDYPKLHTEPLIISIVLCLSRFMQISVRHSLAPASLMAKMRSKTAEEEDFMEILILAAWLVVKP